MSDQNNRRSAEENPGINSSVPRQIIQPEYPEPSVPDWMFKVVEIKTKQSTVHQEQFEQQKNTTDNALVDRIRKSDRLMILLTAIIAFTGIAGAFITRSQTKIMQGQLNEMRDSSKETKTIAESTKKQATDTENLAKATKDLAVAATKQAASSIDQVKELQASVKAAQDANRSARDALVLDQRPWIGIGEINVLSPLAEGQSLKVRVRILNSGKSTAVYMLRYFVLKPWIKPADDLSIPLTNDPAIGQCFKSKSKWNPNLTGGIMPPGATGIYISEESPILSREIIDVITKKSSTKTNAPSMRGIPRSTASEKGGHLTLGLFLVGCIDYFDQFRNPYRTSICYLYDSSGIGQYGDFSDCAKGNAAD